MGANMTILTRLAPLLTLLLTAVGLLIAAPPAHAQVIYYHTDALGSPVAITDASGQVIERSEYEPYGRLLNHALTDGPGYTGHVSDAMTGLSYMQQRYYDPLLQIFISVDPNPVDTTTAYNFCRYCYARLNPYRFTDPDGRDGTETFAETDAWGDVNYANSRTMTAEDSLRGLIIMRDIFLSQFSDGPGGAVAGPLGVATKGATIVEKGGAAAERAKNLAKGVPESRLGPSGKPKVHTVEHSTRKGAKEAAAQQTPPGGKVRNDAHPQDGQKPHFQAENAKGENVKPVVHHCKPNKAC